MSTDDPCTCDVLCPHGTKCPGGHANYPDDHWWPHCEDGCDKPAAESFRLANGLDLMVVSGCWHAIGPARPLELAHELRRHLGSCAEARPGRLERQTSER